MVRSAFVILLRATLLAAGLLVPRGSAQAAGDPWAPGVAENISYSLLPTDPTVAPQSIRYAGRRVRKVYDRRARGYITINAYVYNVAWPSGNSEFVINPEVGAESAARKMVDQFVPRIGRLPLCLRHLVKHVTIHQGNMPLGGGNEGMLIYAGRNNGAKSEEIFVHEAAHNLGHLIGTSTAWKTAQNKDKIRDPAGSGFISKYAREHPTREDVPESFLAWLALRREWSRLTPTDRQYIKDRIPNRLAYFDHYGCDTFPVGTN